MTDPDIPSPNAPTASPAPARRPPLARSLFNRPNIHEGILAQIPLQTRGKLYVSPMPFGPYDRYNRLLRMYRRHRIRRAVVLLTDDEIRRKARRNLCKAYAAAGIETLHHPIADWTSPGQDVISRLIPELARLLHYENVVIHCNAGVGRTGIVTACLVKYLTHCTGEEALAFVKQYMQIRITTEQTLLLLKWSAAMESP